MNITDILTSHGLNFLEGIKYKLSKLSIDDIEQIEKTIIQLQTLTGNARLEVHLRLLDACYNIPGYKIKRGITHELNQYQPQTKQDLLISKLAKALINNPNLLDSINE